MRVLRDAEHTPDQAGAVGLALGEGGEAQKISFVRSCALRAAQRA